LGAASDCGSGATAAWIETRLMDQIADDYRPWGAPSQSAD
jgi:hypothetical protein